MCNRSVVLRSLISLEGADSGPPGETSAREMEATQRTVSCMNACRVEDIFADSKFLRAESLHELVKAIMWASGPIKRVASSGEDSDTAQVSPRCETLPNWMKQQTCGPALAVTRACVSWSRPSCGPLDPSRD